MYYYSASVHVQGKKEKETGKTIKHPFKISTFNTSQKGNAEILLVFCKELKK